jgi:mercuric reductase
MNQMEKTTGTYKVKIKDSQVNNPGNHYDLIAIGGGSAAFSAALTASGLGKKTLIVNDGLPIGGTCVNVGCVPSKVLIRAAQQFHNTRKTNFRGIKPGTSRIDFNEIISQKTGIVESLRQKKYIDIVTDDPNVKILDGKGKILDRQRVSVNGKIYTAGNILIATGSSTFVPEIPGIGEIKYYTNENLYELESLPEHLIILGGRYMALENAQMFVRLGAAVTILQRSSSILPNESPDISEALEVYLKEEGINIKTKVTIKSVKKIEDKIEIDFAPTSCSHLFAATGRKGNSEDVGLMGPGIKTFGKGFVKVDEHLQTNIPGIYAAGDIIGENLFVYTAAYEGALAAKNALTKNRVKRNYNPLPWVIFTDPQAAGIGPDEKQAKKAGIDYDISKISLKEIPRAIAAQSTKGFIKLIRDKKTDKLVGARILASEGSELLMELALAIKYGITVREIKEMFHPYLTLSEGVKLAAIGFEKDIGSLSCCAT